MAAEEVADSAALVRGLLGAAHACGVDVGRLACDAEIPDWVLSAGQPLMVPLRHARRVWELAEHALGVPDVPLAMASRFGLGGWDLLDYLFATAPTVRDGAAVMAGAVHLLTTNGRLRIEAGDEGSATYSYYWHVPPGGRAEELSLQFLVLSMVRRTQMAAGRPVVPSQVTFAQGPPRSHRALGEALGTRRLDFGAPLTTVTFRSRDLDLPLRGADPVLAGILTRYARSLPAAPLADWRELFRLQLAEALAVGQPTLAEMGRRMAASPRTVQRHLAEYGTTWRAELEAARQRLASSSSADRTALARRLGYADPGSVRRAMRRWESRS
jgi:AraC-like DNA-binding protein